MRSVTPSPTSRKLRIPLPVSPQLLKSKSSADIHSAATATAAGSTPMAAAAVASPSTAQRLPGGVLDGEASYDTRTSSPLPARRPSVAAASAATTATMATAPTGLADDTASPDYKPDLAQEVAMLSTKLVNAINYQTRLDDALQQAKLELEAERKTSTRLWAEKKSLEDMVSNGLLIRKAEVEAQLDKLRQEVAAERAAREASERSKEAAERAKKQVDGEVENLTSALFQEANTMVAAARMETEAAEKRNSQIKVKLRDTEMLLQSQQEQLQDLKLTMERMSERGDNDASAARDSFSSTPTDRAGIFDPVNFGPDTAGAASDFTPEHPLHFTNLLHPVMRVDVAAFADFQELVKCGRLTAQHVRSIGGGSSARASSSGGTSPKHANFSGSLASSSPNLPGAFSFANSSPTTSSSAVGLTPLKDSKFYKRVLTEDLEPTLRLDLAPGLSFLSRRTVQSSLLNGTLIVEPFTPQQKSTYGPLFTCSLCGESRKQEPYLRKHRFRTSESDDAQRYPLCDYCLGRVRSSGDFISFLRMVRDGHWRCDKDEEEKTAWEESVRLRERMFWARLGGGVVPAVQRHLTGESAAETGGGHGSTKAVKSARHSLESVPETTTATPARHERGASTATTGIGADRESGGSSPHPSASSSSSSAPPDQQSSSQRLSAEADAQLQEESAAAAIAHATPLLTVRPSDSELQVGSEGRPSLSRSNTDSSFKSTKSNVQQPAEPTERRPSAVLARVRAMEARSK